MKQALWRCTMFVIVPVLNGVLLLAGLAIPTIAQRLASMSPIDDSDRVSLPHTTHPLARAALDIGAAEPDLRMERMLLVLGPGEEAQPQLRSLLDSQHDKQSPNYHKWITPEQFGEQFGPSEQDLEKITIWLQQKGFDSIKPARGRGSIEFSGTVLLVQEAFATSMRYYQVGGERHLANGSDISIPRGMSGIVRGVSLENFSFAKPTLSGAYAVTRDADAKFVRIDPQANFNGNNFLSPGDYAKIYDLSSLYNNHVDGEGVTIAVVARSNVVLSDVEAFRQAFNLPPNEPHIVVNGQDPGPTLGLDLVEASLDTEWTGAIAPKATVDVVVSQSTATTDGLILSSTYIVDNNLADIMSMSFSACEQNLSAFSLNSFFNALYQQAAAEGISVLVSTGDAGAADCDASFPFPPAQDGLAVNGLASTPFDTAVGGTQFNDTAKPSAYWGPVGPGEVSVLGYIPEMVWNESCDPSKSTCPAPSLSAGGGGVSNIYSKPSWQSTGVLGVPNDGKRDLPDVSLTGAVHDDYLFCVALFAPCSVSGSGTKARLLSAGAVGGTSASVQAFAGIMALVDQHQGGRQGLANYVLYKLAAKEVFAKCNSSKRTDPSEPAPSGCVFNDITAGNNGVPGNDTLTGKVPPGDVDGQLGYNAVPGYDPATGLGSVDGANLVHAWNSVIFRGSTTTLAVSGPTSIKHGQAISFNVQVKPVAGSGTPTGPVVLIAKNAPAPFNGAAVGSGTLTHGTFRGMIESLPGGQYQVVAHYGGDGAFGGSESGGVDVNITQERSAVALTTQDRNGNSFSAPGSVTQGYGFGWPLQITVTSASGSGVPTGTVTLMDGGIRIAQLPLNSQGQAVFINCDQFSAQFCLNLGQHAISVSYSGDNSVRPSSSPVLTISLVKSPAIFLAGLFCCFTPITAEVEVDFETGEAALGIAPTGTVSFLDSLNGGALKALGSPVSLAQGPIIFRYFDLAPGLHSLTIQYSGDNTYLSSGTTPPPIVIQGSKLPPTRTTLKRLTTPIVEGQPVKFEVTVTSPGSPVVPTGDVVVLAGASFVNLQGNFTLKNGSAIAQGIMPNASPVVQAFYFGDSKFRSSSSPPMATAAAKITAPLKITSDVHSATPGTQVSLVATITPPVGLDQPQGTVQFFDSLNGGKPTPLGQTQVVLLGGSATGAQTGTAAIAAVLSTAGVHTITAAYSGDPDYNSVSQSLSVTVSGLQPSNPSSGSGI